MATAFNHSRAMRLAAFVLIGLAVIAMAIAPKRSEAQTERVVAVVNDTPITSSDLSARLRLSLVAAGLSPSQGNQERILPQVMQLLIDERIQLVEARRNGISISDQDVEVLINRIAEQNNMGGEQLKSGLTRAGVPLFTLYDQLRAQLAWRELVRRRLIPQVRVSDTEVDEQMAKAGSGSGRAEYLLAEIFLAVDDTAREAEIRRLATELIGQIRRGAPFSSVARQFSQGADAQSGGDIGWIQEGQLEPALDQAVQALAIGQISEPIRTSAGYHILLLRDERTAGQGGDASASRDEIASSILNQRVDVLQRRYMRDLRQQAFVEIRN